MSETKDGRRKTKENKLARPQQTWETYEEVAAYLLDRFAYEFGIEHFEGKQVVPGRLSGTQWEIDAKGVAEDDELFLVVECRRHTSSKQNQEKVAALAYRIQDTGAAGGIIVSPLGLQEGAARVAQANNIESVILDANSTTTDYILTFLVRTHRGMSAGPGNFRLTGGDATFTLGRASSSNSGSEQP